jgi:hypothetical protein
MRLLRQLRVELGRDRRTLIIGQMTAHDVLGCWGATEQNAELRILLQIRIAIKSGVLSASAL